MKHTLHYSKQTGGKLRWDKDIEGTLFELYIPKWRVPSPVPEKLYVEFYEYEPDSFHSDEDQYIGDIKLLDDINILLFFDREYTKTFRYTPNKKYYSNNWPIGQPYIPISLIPDKPERLVMHVQWGD